jgi:thymidylate synthase (FAD)
MNNTTNKVELIGHYGGDTTHAMSAWTSTTRDYDTKKERMPGLLKTLAENGHHTPFEKSSLHFLVDTDIATHIHLIKHRVGVSVNAESARYKELKEDKFYLPQDWQGIDMDEDTDWYQHLLWFTELSNKLYHRALQDLTPVLGRKRAKESARFFKTYNSQITSDVMFNFRSFIHFQKLRNDEHAQVEVREVAQQMLQLVQQLPDNPFEHSLKAFGYGPK